MSTQEKDRAEESTEVKDREAAIEFGKNTYKSYKNFSEATCLQDGFIAGILHERSRASASVDREMLKRFAEFVVDDVVKFFDGVITYYPHAIEKLVSDFLEQERAKK